MSEIMTIYRKDGDLSDETRSLCFAFLPDVGGFYDLKADAEALFGRLNVKPRKYVACGSDPSFHPGRCASVTVDGVEIGVIGEVHPLVCENYDLPRGVCAAIISVEALFAAVNDDKSYDPLPVYPAMERDIALICDDGLEVAELLKNIRDFASKALKECFVFDIYRGKGVDDGKKSVAVRLVFRLPDRTLTDEEADNGVQKILKRLESDSGVFLRS